MANPFLFEDTEQLAQPPLSFNPFLSSNEFSDTTTSDNPFLSSFTAAPDTSGTDGSNSATNPFAFGEETTTSDFFSLDQNEPAAVNYENIFSSVPQTTTQVPSKVNVNTNDAFLINEENFITPAEPQASSQQREDASGGDYDNQKDAPRRPPPPRPLPPRETTELIKTVTGAMEATSSHLLDRLQATRTPSPTPMRDLHSPSPTQFGDLLEVDEPFGTFVTDNQPQNRTIPAREINLMDDFDFTPSATSEIQPLDFSQPSPLVTTVEESEKTPTAAPVTPPPTPATMPYQPPLSQQTDRIQDQEPVLIRQVEPEEQPVFAPVELTPPAVTPIQTTAPASVPTPSPIPTPSPVPTPSPAPSPAPTPSQAPTASPLPTPPPPPVSRPPPPSVPQRPKPPPQPPRPAPPVQPQAEIKAPIPDVATAQEITKDEGFADVFGASPQSDVIDRNDSQTGVTENAPGLFDSTFNGTSDLASNPPSLLQDTSSKNVLADDNLNFNESGFGAEPMSQPTDIFATQEKSAIISARDEVTSDFFSDQNNAESNVFGDANVVQPDIFGATNNNSANAFTEPTVPQHSYNIFDAAPPPIKAVNEDAFDAFAAKFDSVPQTQNKIGAENAFDPFGGGTVPQTG